MPYFLLTFGDATPHGAVIIEASRMFQACMTVVVRRLRPGGLLMERRCNMRVAELCRSAFRHAWLRFKQSEGAGVVARSSMMEPHRCRRSRGTSQPDREVVAQAEPPFGDNNAVPPSLAESARPPCPALTQTSEHGAIGVLHCARPRADKRGRLDATERDDVQRHWP
jgi:hypothetical protein